MAVQLKNNVSGFLANSISATDTSIVLQAGQGIKFPPLGTSQYFYATIVDTAGNLEIVNATARAGDTLTVLRGQDGTTARAFPALSRIELRVNASTIYEVIDASISSTPLVISNIASVIRVAEDIDNVNTVADNLTDIDTIVTNIGSVTNVANNMANVVAVGTNIVNVTAVADNAANINSVVANEANINAVADDIEEIIGVGVFIADVHAVALIQNEIETVASIDTEVVQVAGIRSDVQVVSTNTASVVAVAGNQTNVNTVAGISANVTTVAGISSNVTTVASNNANVTTVASNIANVNTAATNIVAIQNAPASAAAAAASASAANASAGQSAGSAAQALAIYGTTNAQQAALINAQAAASQAQGYALSAASVMQQDLSAVSAGLHRSPNAITAMFVYDTGKDSDGGAWTEKCQHTSWYNEALNGKWLGAQVSEFEARNAGATLGNELLTNGNFSSGITGWTIATPATTSITNGALIFNNASSADLCTQTANQTWVSGKTYTVTFDVSSYSGSGQITITRFGQQGILSGITGNGTKRVVFIANNSTACPISIGPSSGWPNLSCSIDNISVREVTALTTASGDYYQLSTDGKFYKLWKNLLRRSEQFDDAVWTKSNTTVVANSTTAPDGTTTADKLSDDAVNSAHRILQAFTPIATPFTYSVYAKYVDIPYIQIAYFDTGVVFNIQNGQVGVGTANTSNATITSVGDGWYRCSFVCNRNAGADAIVISLSTTNQFVFGGYGYIGTGSSAFIWGAQLEYGTSATTYEAKGADGSQTETFRGNKADFPRLAGIVAEASNVTIYDLTEAGRPMWMRFPGVQAGWLLAPFYFSGGANTSVFALNGSLCVGSTGAGLSVAEFCRDVVELTGSHTRRYRKPLSDRGYNVGNDLISQKAIASASVNAVAMTVLPDAPVDPVTGLQVPTIAVATAGGVSVIKHNGTVVSSSSTSAFYGVTLTPQLLTGFTGAQHLGYQNPGALTSSFAANTVLGANATPDFWRQTVQKIAASSRATIARYSTGASAPIGFLRHNESALTRGIAAAIAPTFNTGHMVGDIRRAYLADVDVGSVTGTLILSDDFSTYADTAAMQAAGWTDIAPTASVLNSGKIRVTGGASGGVYRNYGIATIVGKTYRVTCDVTVVSAGTWFVIPKNLVAAGGSNLALVSGSASQSVSVTFVATTTAESINMQVTNAGVVDFDNISITEVIADRSYKASAANITGTLTKSQVAAAAQLVAYSGFSAANYLREPYSADLDFGTGEFTASAWLNVPVTLPAPTLGNEIVTNGTFEADTNWTKGVGWSIAGGVATAVTSGNYANMTQTITTTPGKIYRVSFNVTAISAGQTRLLWENSEVSTWSGATGVRSFYFVATTSSNVVGVRAAFTSNFSVDDFSVKEVSVISIVDRSHSSGASIRLGIHPSGFLTATAFDGTTTRTVTTTATYNTATWLKARVNYRAGRLAILVNGVEVAVTNGAPLLTLNNSNAVLTIGNSFAADAPFPGSLSLVKLSATVPTDDQSVWMYEQEKQMFRDGAQVTLPDAGTIIDLTYDDATDKWIAVSATNESEWSGLVRAGVTPVSAGSYSRASATSGVQLLARATTNPGVDITIPAYGLREELVKRAESAARLARNLATFDYVGGFTANTTINSTAIVSVANLTYPTSYIGALVTGAGIPADTVVDAVIGTTIYLSKVATATATGVAIAFSDFILPVGYEAKEVSLAGAAQREGATAQFTRRFDGFRETIRFGTAPSNTAAIQIQATRSAT